MTIVAPLFAPSIATVPGLPAVSLSPDEAQIASFLATRLFDRRASLELPQLYYDGLQKMQDLGISIPPQLRNLRTVLGWPRIGIDATANRCRVEGFRYPDTTDTDEDLWEIWQANCLDGESQLVHQDALTLGRAYIVVGPGDDPKNDPPLITAESAMNMTGLWDARMRQCTAALQLYLDLDYGSDTYGQEIAALYLPDTTIQMGRNNDPAGSLVQNGQWSLISRDDHNLGQVPVVKMANRQRLMNREGVSEIQASWMNTVDSACRTQLAMEVGREFYAAPRRYALGASEEDFQGSDGTAKSGWESYQGLIWALERDADGEVPTVGEFAAADPSVYTKVLNQYAQNMSGDMSVPPHFLGLYAEGNPASADAIRASYENLTTLALNKHSAFADPWEDAMRLALLISTGKLPEGANRMETDWADPAPKTPAATADAVAKMVQVGSLPATANVTLKLLGLSQAQIASLAIDRKKDEGASILAELASGLLAKEAKVDTTIAKDIDPAATAGVTPATPAAGVPTPAAPTKAPVQPPAKG